MNQLANLKLRWYDESGLTSDDPQTLLSLFLDAIGVTSPVARDIFHVLLSARSQDIGLSTADIKREVVALREREGRDVEEGLTDRNIQLWLAQFRELGLVDRLGRRHRFTANKTPSRAFAENTIPDVIEPSIEYAKKALGKLEKSYGIV